MHEAGHADFRLCSGWRDELARAFAALPPSPTCAALRAAAHDLFADAVVRLKAKHRRYDMRTRHGATQGQRVPLEQAVPEKPQHVLDGCSEVQFTLDLGMRFR